MFKKALQLLGILIFLYMSYVMVYAFNHKDSTALPAQAVKASSISYRQDPQVVNVLDELGLKYDTLNLIYGSNPVFPESNSASFTQPNTIYLSPNIDPSEIHLAISHEYIHYMQVKDPQSETFLPYMTELYQNNSWLYNRMSWYRSNQTCDTCLTMEQEVQSVACTEMSDRQLRQDFRDWCNSHLPKRYSLL